VRARIGDEFQRYGKTCLTQNAGFDVISRLRRRGGLLLVIVVIVSVNGVKSIYKNK
jgi:hypothetical protein